MRVIVTRPASEARLWCGDLQRRALPTVSLPLIEIFPPPRPQAVTDAWARLAAARAAMFVSGNAVRHFFALRPADCAWPPATRAWGTGPGTREALLEAGVAPAQVDTPTGDAPQYDSEALWQLVAAQVRPADAVMVVRGVDEGATGPAGLGRSWLADQLSAAGVRVDTVVSYRRGVPRWSDEQRLQAQALSGPESLWLFSSSQAIDNLRVLLPGQVWATSRAVTTHHRIAQAARDAGFAVVCESRPSLDAVVAALESFR